MLDQKVIERDRTGADNLLALRVAAGVRGDRTKPGTRIAPRWLKMLEVTE